MHSVFLFLIFSLTGTVRGALYIDLSGGFGGSSKYQYYECEPVDAGTSWLTFDPIGAFCANSRLSIDIWKNEWRFGVAGGFLRRYELHLHSASLTDKQREKIGEVLSIPLIGFMEGRRRSFFYEFGLGPYITRFNYHGYNNDISVTSLFGFLFGAGYDHELFPGVRLQARGELLVNAPVFLVDFLDEGIKEEIRASRFTEYNSNEFQSVTYSAVIFLGLQYEFGEKVRIPLDDGVGILSGLVKKAFNRNRTRRKEKK